MLYGRESEGGREGYVGCTVVRIEPNIAFIYKKAKYSGEFNATHSAPLFARFIGGGKKPCPEGTLYQKERDKTFCLFVCPQATCFANIFMLCHPRVAMTCTYKTNVHTYDNSVKYLR